MEPTTPATKPTSAVARVWRWIPIDVVALLLIGLAIAVTHPHYVRQGECFNDASADGVAHQRQSLAAHVQCAAILVGANEQVDVDVPASVQELPGAFEHAGRPHADMRQAWSSRIEHERGVYPGQERW